MAARRACIVVACLPFLCAAHVRAQADESPDTLTIEAPPELIVSPDRPGFAFTPFTVPAMHVQIEAGFVFTSSDDGDSRGWEVGQPLLRVGVTDWAELRITLPSWSYKDQDGSSSDSGGTDITVGTKLQITEQSGWVPSIGVIAAMSAPTGAAAFTADDVQPQATVDWQYDLDSGFSVSGQFLFQSLVSDDNRFFEFAPSVALNVPLGERAGAFVEYYGKFRARGGGGPEHYFDGGLTYLLTNRIQVDVWAGIGLNDRADDYFVGGGISMLF